MTNIHDDWRCRKCNCPNSDMVSVCRNCGTHEGDEGPSSVAIVILVILFLTVTIIAVNAFGRKKDGEKRFPIIDDVKDVRENVL